MRPLFASLLLAAGTLAGPPAARAGHYLEVEVIDRDTGHVATVHAFDGEYWLAGTPGHRYAVRLHNRTGERVLAVLSVDGVNAVSGETASTQQAGYVLGPWQTTEVAGWRKSLHDVAQFEFTALPDSYAARTGRPENVGVIGVAVFRERAPRRRWREDEISARPAPSGEAKRYGGRDAAAESAPRSAPAPATAPAPSLGRIAGPPADAKLGTGHGAREWSQARQVAFERDSAHPVEVHALRYDSERNLVAMGVLPPPWHHARRPRPQPDPFPVGFVPDPRW